MNIKDVLLHLLGGALITGIISNELPKYSWVALLVVLLIGFGRELKQHKTLNPLSFTLHVWIEALAWFVGALLVLLIKSFF